MSGSLKHSTAPGGSASNPNLYRGGSTGGSDLGPTRHVRSRSNASAGFASSRTGPTDPPTPYSAGKSLFSLSQSKMLKAMFSQWRRRTILSSTDLVQSLGNLTFLEQQSLVCRLRRLKASSVRATLPSSSACRHKAALVVMCVESVGPNTIDYVKAAPPRSLYLHRKR